MLNYINHFLMESKIVYHCTGSCGGTTHEEKSCQAVACTMHDQPLKGYQQCEACAATEMQDHAPHWCEMCKPL